VPGNLPQNSECVVCDEECGHGAGLVDLQCSWCKVTSHEKCKQRYTAICDFGKMKEFIIPPSSVKLRHRDILSEFEKWKHPFQRSSSLEQISEITAPSWADERWTPLLIFVNTKSGNGEGALIMDLFRQYLNPIQVHDLANYGPESVLKLCKLVSKTDTFFKIIVAGGDGTIGTGNDLSRLLGCGSAFDCSRMDIHQILLKIEQSEMINIDRWIINVEQRRLGEISKLKNVALSQPLKIGQAKEVKLFIKKGPLPMQVDGEPWLQYGPATVTITRFGRATFLATSNSELSTKNADKNAAGDYDFNLAENSSDFFYFE
uniref:Diacylglycerol kinase (ATP) n=1 Tax=Romanomermis culicivorax TaxID=13658 RepID=A0A915J405_ROMCU